MAQPLYIELGFTKTEIATYAKTFGLVMTILGTLLGGVLVMRFGVMKSLLIGAILVASTNMLFSYLAYQGKSIPLLAAVIAGDNMSAGLATAAFIAYLSSLVNKSYTATQYALFSSLMTLPGKIISGFAGKIVAATSFSTFFLYASAAGLPVIAIILILMTSCKNV